MGDVSLCTSLTALLLGVAYVRTALKAARCVQVDWVVNMVRRSASREILLSAIMGSCLCEWLVVQGEMRKRTMVFGARS